MHPRVDRSCSILLLVLAACSSKSNPASEDVAAGDDSGAVATGDALAPGGDASADASQNPTEAGPSDANGARDTGLPDLLASAAGAHPNDGIDDLGALTRAALMLKNGQRLVLEGGEYDLDLGALPPTISIWDKSDIEVVGNGARLVLRKFDVSGKNTLGAGVLSFGNCSRVNVHDVTIDMDRPPFSQGTVTSVGAGDFTLQVDAAYPVSASIKIEALLNYDATTGLPKGAGFDLYNLNNLYQVAEVAPQQLRITAPTTGLQVGDRVVIRHNVYEQNGIFVQNCQDFSVNDVTVYSVPGMGLYSQGSSDLTVQRFHVLKRPDSGRLMSTTADGIHFAGTGGMLTVVGSELEGMGDDGMNVHSTWLKVASVDAAHSSLVAAAHSASAFVTFAPGEQVEFADANLQLKGTAKVASAPAVAQGSLNHTLVLDTLPAGLDGSWVLFNATRLPTVNVTSTTVRGNRARGFLLQSRDVTVDGCTFQNCTAAAIHVTTDIDYWFEAPGARKVTIRNSTIDGVNKGAASGPGAIYVFAQLADGSDAPAGVHQGITIANNQISNTPESAVFVGSSQTVSVTGNKFTNVSTNPQTATGHYGVYVKNSDSVMIDDNQGAGNATQGLGQMSSTNVSGQGNTF